MTLVPCHCGTFPRIVALVGGCISLTPGCRHMDPPGGTFDALEGERDRVLTIWREAVSREAARVLVEALQEASEGREPAVCEPEGKSKTITDDARAWPVRWAYRVADLSDEDRHALADLIEQEVRTWPGPVLPDAGLCGLARHESADWSAWTRRNVDGEDVDPGKPWGRGA